jgi:hypothetical protein
VGTKSRIAESRTFIWLSLSYFAFLELKLYPFALILIELSPVFGPSSIAKVVFMSGTSSPDFKLTARL